MPQKTAENKPLREAESEIEDEMLSLRPQAKGHKWPKKLEKTRKWKPLEGRDRGTSHLGSEIAWHLCVVGNQ